jgi:Carboxyl transferase domain
VTLARDLNGTAPAAPGAAEIGTAKARALAGGDAGRWPGKLRVAERLAALLDPGSWTEDGLLANAEADGLPADGVRTGVGRVDGRKVAVIAHDFAVKAGSWGELTCEKQIRILERADRDLLPVIYLVDSAGGRLDEQMGFFRVPHLQPSGCAVRAGTPDLLPARPVRRGRCVHAGVHRLGRHGRGPGVDVPRLAAGGREGHRRAHDA